MAYGIQYSISKNQVKHLPTHIQIKAEEAVLLLSEDPFLGIPLEPPYKGYLKHRLSRTYRLVYTINQYERLIKVYRVGHKKNVYRNLSCIAK